MFKSPSPLHEDARMKIVELLNGRLADGLDLHSQIKVAHWNVKGPQFAALHPLFESFAVALAAFNDEVASLVERYRPAAGDPDEETVQVHLYAFPLPRSPR